ncbi:Sterile alpha motif domain-containing protein [Dioscorea alata]|uniref:Sterile alpha motif domain-containing protein n=1 Tax=Dioscorea alata TaxID=55571 RepID=A0ACB7TV48_DIOAL|nr:Sterile alpha motif domain-containing protein [Dioscorea alata]
MDVAPSSVLTDTPNLLTDHEPADEGDDWVVVKKQRIIFLVPPPSPSVLPRSIPENSQVDPPKKRRRRRSSGKKHKTPTEEALKDDTQMEHEVHNSTVVQLIDQPEVHESHQKSRLRSACRSTIGAANVVNIRVRASNFEKKIRRLGGLRKWLVSQGLTRFSTVFDKEKFSLYQLVTLTMSKLKEIGVDAVGPRRKLIHAIDSLCQPYFIKSLQVR